MEKEEIKVEETVVPEKEIEKVEEKATKKPNTLTIVLAVLVILLLIPVVGMVLFKFDIPHQKGKPVEKVENQESECTGCLAVPEKECDCPACPKNQETVANPGWMKHIASDVKLSIETPSYSTKQDLGGEEVRFTWDVRMSQIEYTEYLYFDNYVKTISAHFFPERLPDGFGCGAGCARENIIDIQIFKNNKNLTLEQARDRLITKFNEANQEEGSITGSIKTKWNEKTYEYTTSTPGGTFLGNLVVKNGYIYDVGYLLAGTEGDSLNNAKKVLNSIVFN